MTARTVALTFAIGIAACPTLAAATVPAGPTVSIDPRVQPERALDGKTDTGWQDGARSSADGQDEPEATPTAEPRPFRLSENRISISHIFGATAPGHWSRNEDLTIDGTTEKTALSFTHFDTWKLGTNYIDVTIYKSGRNDPAAPCRNARSTPPSGGSPSGLADLVCPGETEVYVVARSTIALAKILRTADVRGGFMRNVSLEAGFDLNEQNDFNDAAKRAALAGLRFDFQLPYSGSISVAPMVYYEFANHSRFLECSTVPSGGGPTGLGRTCTAGGRKHYDPTWSVEISYKMGLGFLPGYLRHLTLSGRANFRGPKGNQNAPLGRDAGGTPTATEINSEPVRLTFDVSAAVAGSRRRGGLELWVAYRYWRNKFGIDADTSPTCFTNIRTQSNRSCTESSFVIGSSLKL